MTIDFEQEVDHYGVNSIKWEFMVDDRVLKHWDLTDPDLGDQSVLPMWVADMDFLAAPPIVEAVTRRATAFGETALSSNLAERMHVQAFAFVVVVRAVNAGNLGVEHGALLVDTRPVTNPLATHAGEAEAHGALLAPDTDAADHLILPVDQHRRLLVEVPVLLADCTGNDFASEAEDAEQQQVELLAVHFLKSGERDHNGQVVDDCVLLTLLARVTPRANLRRRPLPLFTGRKRGKAPCPALYGHAKTRAINGHLLPPGGDEPCA